MKKLIFVCGFNNYLGIDKDFDAVNEPMFIDNLEDVKKRQDESVIYIKRYHDHLKVAKQYVDFWNKILKA